MRKEELKELLHSFEKLLDYDWSVCGARLSIDGDTFTIRYASDDRIYRSYNLAEYGIADFFETMKLFIAVGDKRRGLLEAMRTQRMSDWRERMLTEIGI